MKVRLVVEAGGKRKTLNLRPPEAILGRAHGNTVRIPSAEVSRQHCKLILDDGLVTLEDLDSVNGTFLNGSRIRKTEVVRPGDQLSVGPVSFVVEYELTPDALDRLRGQTDDIELLEALAEDADEVEVLADAEEDLPVIDAVDDEQVETIKGGNDFDFGGWSMPEGGEFRDILTQMEDDDPPTRKKR